MSYMAILSINLVHDVATWSAASIEIVYHFDFSILLYHLLTIFAIKVIADMNEGN